MMSGIEAAARSREQLIRWIDFNGREIVPRRDVRSVEGKHGLPMADFDSGWRLQTTAPI